VNLVQIKPMSMNQAWRAVPVKNRPGIARNVKSRPYRKYEMDVSLQLPATFKLPPPPYAIYLEFGLSNKNADWDNPIKPFVDILQARYKFNDKEIRTALVTKVIVTKGQEYVRWDIVTQRETILIRMVRAIWEKIVGLSPFGVDTSASST